MKNSNLLKIKSRSNRFYVFDAITNNIYELGSKCDLKNIQLLDLGHESDSRKNALVFDGMHQTVKLDAKTLIIELTEQCNIRCSYCVFDESDETERNHSDVDISEDLALNSIDNFFKRTNGEEGYLVFYGGEPLLKFPLIRKIVEHANKISKHKIKFSFTTNGVTLTMEKFDFLVKNDFKITVSVDGPKFIHDKRRVSKNGKGTFSIIERNLSALVDFDEDFYYKNVEFNCTISDFDDISYINKFFQESRLFKKEFVRFAPIISAVVNLDKKISLSISDKDLRVALNAGGSVIFKSSGDNDFHLVDPVQDAFMGDILRKIKYRKIDEEAGSGKKICVPFANRTYVRVNGDVQFCERVQSYGVLREKDDLEKASQFLLNNFYSFKAGSCEKCFAYNFCDMCPASFIVNGQLSEEISNKKCSDYRRNVKRAMSIYIDSMEIGEV